MSYATVLQVKIHSLDLENYKSSSHHKYTPPAHKATFTPFEKKVRQIGFLSLPKSLKSAS